MKGYIDRMSKAKVTDLKKHYPDLAPDKDYPPLKFKSLKGRVSAAEWEARVDCACAYRLVRHYDMHDLIYNHISARIPGTEEFLLNPFGLLYEEMCASSLIKVDLEGKVLWGGRPIGRKGSTTPSTSPASSSTARFTRRSPAFIA